MLAKGTYDRSYVDAVRAEVDRQLAAFRRLKAPGDFEAVFANDLVLVLEQAFVHRLRVREGKDGNALNEVRLLATSLLENGGRLVADKQIKLRPETSVLGLAAGDEIGLTVDDAERLAAAFFKALEERFL